MIIWINGAYGVGKSTLAEALKEKNKDLLIFDAEEVGNAVRENYPNCPYGYIFEDYPLWGEFCFKLLQDIHTNFKKDIVVPMTLVREKSYEIIENLRKAGIDTRLITLDGSYETIHDRILARGEEEGCWCMENIELSCTATKAFPGLHINTDNKEVNEVLETVLESINK